MVGRDGATRRRACDDPSGVTVHPYADERVAAGPLLCPVRRLDPAWLRLVRRGVLARARRGGEMTTRQRAGLFVLLLAILIVAGNGGVDNMTGPQLLRQAFYVLGGGAMLIWPDRRREA